MSNKSEITYRQSTAHYCQGTFPLCLGWHEIVDILRLHILPLLASPAHPKHQHMYLCSLYQCHKISSLCFYTELAVCVMPMTYIPETGTSFLVPISGTYIMGITLEQDTAVFRDKMAPPKNHIPQMQIHRINSAWMHIPISHTEL